jgi:hypothetical protein
VLYEAVSKRLWLIVAVTTLGFTYIVLLALLGRTVPVLHAWARAYIAVLLIALVPSLVYVIVLCQPMLRLTKSHLV